MKFYLHSIQILDFKKKLKSPDPKFWKMSNSIIASKNSNVLLKAYGAIKKI